MAVSEVHRWAIARRAIRTVAPIVHGFGLTRVLEPRRCEETLPPAVLTGYGRGPSTDAVDRGSELHRWIRSLFDQLLLAV